MGQVSDPRKTRRTSNLSQISICIAGISWFAVYPGRLLYILRADIPRAGSKRSQKKRLIRSDFARRAALECPSFLPHLCCLWPWHSTSNKSQKGARSALKLLPSFGQPRRWNSRQCRYTPNPGKRRIAPKKARAATCHAAASRAGAAMMRRWVSHGWLGWRNLAPPLFDLTSSLSHLSILQSLHFAAVFCSIASQRGSVKYFSSSRHTSDPETCLFPPGRPVCQASHLRRSSGSLFFSLSKHRSATV